MKQTIAFTSVATLLALCFAMTAQAASPTFGSSTTTANVASSTVPAITFAGGAAAVAATATLTATTQANMANNDYVILSHTGVAATSVCFYFDKSNALSDDSGTAAACQAANGVAGGVEVDISAATTAAQVAAALHAQINSVVAQLTVTSTNNGDGTLTLTNDTAGTSGNIAVNSGYWTEGVTNAAFTLTALAGGAAATAATSAITIPAGLVANAFDHSVTIDGVVIDLGTSAKTAAQVATSIAGATYTGGTNYGTGAYTVGAAGDVVTYTKSAAGTGGNGSVTIADASYGRIAQVVVFTPADVASGYTYEVVLNGTAYTYTGAATTVQQVVEGLQALMASASGITCTEDNASITCTANTPGTEFTYTAAIRSNAFTSSSQTSGGGSGSRQAVVWTGVASTPTINVSLGTIVTTSVMPKNNVSLGAKGSAVVAIQEYLIKKNVGPAAEALADAGATGNFGPLTKKALAEFQKSVGISPATGNYGPATRAYIASH